MVIRSVGFSLPLAGLVALAAGCAPARETVIPTGIHAPYESYSSAKYRDDANWLCRPGMKGDNCQGDLTATEIHPDGSRTLVPHQPAADPKVDCFYVYPTVDLGLVAANHTSFTDIEPMRRTVLAQAARFGEVCAVYAPLYRQVTIGTYFASDARGEPYFATAFSDVLDAFLHYMGQHNHGRKVVLIGHSQGGEMVNRLLRKLFDGDETMRARLVVALSIGADVEVPAGKKSGVTFATIPLCSRPEEQGCVVAFRTHHAGAELPARLSPALGNETACVNPSAAPGDGPKRLSRAFYPTEGKRGKDIKGIDGVNTPYVLYRDYYEGQCVESPRGYFHLAISTAATPGETRLDPVNLSDRRLNSFMGTHILDLQFTQGDLIDLVARKISPASAPSTSEAQ